MKILHLFFSIEKGGAETYLFNMIKGIKNKDYEISVICDHIGYNHNKIESMGIRNDFIKMNSIFDLKAAHKLATYCRKNKIQIIHTHFLRESFIAVLAKLFYPKIKIVWTMHFIYNKSKSLQILNKLFSKYVHKIICVSRAVEKHLISEGISSDKTKTIYNCVDLDKFKSLESKTSRVKFGVKGDELLLITVARFQKAKGHSFLVDVINELKNYEIKFKCLLIGDGEEFDDIKRKVENLKLSDEIIFTGFREDIPELLSASDIYLSPSESEAISFSILESLACGTPVIATRVGGVPEILEGSKSGIMLSYGAAKEFAKAIYDLYNNKQEYSQMKENGRELIKDRFSLEKMCKETVELYREAFYGEK